MYFPVFGSSRAAEHQSDRASDQHALRQAQRGQAGGVDGRGYERGPIASEEGPGHVSITVSADTNARERGDFLSYDSTPVLKRISYLLILTRHSLAFFLLLLLLLPLYHVI